MANQLPRRIAEKLDIWDIKIGKIDKIDPCSQPNVDENTSWTGKHDDKQYTDECFLYSYLI